MKKNILLISLVLVSMAGAMAFAQEAEKNIKKDYTINIGESQVMTGAIESVLLSDLTRPNAKIAITSDNGAVTQFTVKPSALVFAGSTGALMTLHDVMPGDKAAVNYRVKNGVYEAVAIKIIK